MLTFCAYYIDYHTDTFFNFQSITYFLRTTEGRNPADMGTDLAPSDSAQIQRYKTHWRRSHNPLYSRDQTSCSSRLFGKESKSAHLIVLIGQAT